MKKLAGHKKNTEKPRQKRKAVNNSKPILTLWGRAVEDAIIR
jgi:hypothetical protein